MYHQRIRPAVLLSRTLLAACVGLWSTCAMAQVAWDMSMEDQPTSLPGEGATAFAKDVAERTDGQLVITVHHSGSLGMKNADHLTAVQDGVLPLAQSLAGAFATENRLFLMSSLPFVAKNFDEAQELLDLARPAYTKALADYNQIYLYSSPFPPSGIWAKVALSTTDDVKPLKVRTYDAVSTEVMRNLGTTPVQISFSDIIPQLSTGAIDSVLTSADGGRSLKFWEFMGYFNNVGYAFPLNITAVNKDMFDDLSPELQADLMDAAAAAEKRDWAAARDWEAKNNAILAENGVTTVTDFSPDLLDALSAASKPVVDDWAAEGPEGAEILKAFAAKTAAE